MLYHYNDLRRGMMAPVRRLARAAEHYYTNPFMPFAYAPRAQAVAAGASVLEGVLRPRGQPDWRLTETVINGVRARVSQTVVDKKPFCHLLRFDREPERGRDPGGPRVLIVAPMSGHYATLLRGTVEAMLPGHEVYITDWQDARDVPQSHGRFGFDTYVSYLMDFMRLLGPELHVMAVCQPCPPVLAASALMAQAGEPATPRSMILMGGPVDARAADTEVTRLARVHSLDWFERHMITVVPLYYAGGRRRVYPGFLQLRAFMSMNLSRHVDAHVSMFRHLVEGDGESAAAHREFYDEYLAVMDVTGEFYLETIDRVFQRHALARGELRWNDILVEPAAIRSTALMTVEGARDDISAPGQTRAAHDLCTGLSRFRQAHLLQPGVGHYGVFNGRRWRDEIQPRVARFIRRHDQRHPLPFLINRAG